MQHGGGRWRGKWRQLEGMEGKMGQEWKRRRKKERKQSVDIYLNGMTD